MGSVSGKVEKSGPRLLFNVFVGGFVEDTDCKTAGDYMADGAVAYAELRERFSGGGVVWRWGACCCCCD